MSLADLDYCTEIVNLIIPIFIFIRCLHIFYDVIFQQQNSSINLVRMKFENKNYLINIYIFRNKFLQIFLIIKLLELIMS